MTHAFNYSHLSSFPNGNSHYRSNRNDEKNHRFEIHTLEWMETQRSSWNSEPEKLGRFEVIWIKKGTGSLWADEQRMDIIDNTIYCLSPGTVRKCIIETNLEGYYISFTPEFIWLSSDTANNSSWIGQIDNSSNVIAIRIKEEMQLELEVIARKMKWEFSNYFNQKLDLLKGFLNVFLIYFSRNIEKPAANEIKSQESELVRKFLGLVKKNFITQKMVSSYAGELCVTPNYLNRIVKKVTGFTASQQIQQQIILETKRKAIYSDVSMKEIAYSLGFDNPAHFSKFFKNMCGMSFTDYKKNAIKPR